MTTDTSTTALPADPIAPLVDRYIALWNDPDPTTRAAAIRSIWAPHGTQVLEAPEDVRARVRRFGFPTATLEVRGYDELEHRVACSFDEFVASGAHRFALREPGQRLGRLVKFSWSMVSTATDTAVGGGVQVLVLGDDDRVLVDHQFIDA